MVALDCEFVKAQEQELLARVSIVNHLGEILIDTLVSNDEPVSDYITHITGITPEMLVGAPSYAEVNEYVVSLLTGTTIIGHTL